MGGLRSVFGILVKFGGFTNRTLCDIVKRSKSCEFVHEQYLTGLGHCSSQIPSQKFGAHR